MNKQTSKTEAPFKKARKVMPGGVNSSVRVNQATGLPLLASRAKAGRVWDVDGNEFIDFCCAHGAGLLGHAAPGCGRGDEDGYGNGLRQRLRDRLSRGAGPQGLQGRPLPTAFGSARPAPKPPCT